MWLKQLKVGKAPNSRARLTRRYLLPLVQTRTPLHHKQLPFILCWSQKAGCTAILKWFFYHANLIDAATEHHSLNRKLQIHNYENEVFKARRGYKQELVDVIVAGKPAIKFIRCPYQRLFSSFLQLNNVRFLRRIKSGQTTPGMLLRQRVIDFVHGESMDIGSPLSFGRYIDWLKEQTPETLDPHHAPQCTLLDDSIKMAYYRLEDFNQSIDSLERKFSLEKTSDIRDRFSSAHHSKRQHVSKFDALRFLYEALPLSQFGNVHLPKITEELLEETEFAPVIHDLFERDIAVYKSIDAINEVAG